MEQPVIIVSGLPRSGTSMMMQVLEAGGIKILKDNIRKSDEDNPKGYYEFEQVKKIEKDKTWLKDAPGRAVKMVYRLLYHLPDNYRYNIIFMQRDIREVIASQNRMLARAGKKDEQNSDEKMAELFEKDVRQCLKWLEKKENISVLQVPYRRMVTQPRLWSGKIKEFLGLELDVEKMYKKVDVSLYRNRVD